MLALGNNTSVDLQNYTYSMHMLDDFVTAMFCTKSTA